MPMIRCCRNLLLSALLLTLTAGSAFAEEYTLSAEELTIAYPGFGSVPMWGFALAGEGATVPGPALAVSDGTLTVHLTNNLPEPVSLILPGQSLPAVSGGTPAAASFTDSLGRSRTTSFVPPVAPGETLTYSWTGLRAGTYLYQSGSHISVQVPMGLYGALAVSGAPPYDGSLPELTLLFSEIDIAMHAAVAAGIYGDKEGPYPTALKVGYAPELLLLNGVSFAAATATTLNPEPIAAGDTVLVRLLNAGLATRAPSFVNLPRLTSAPGHELQLAALDGHLLPTPRREAGPELPAGATRDLLLTLDGASGSRYLPVYDRMLGLAHGGMLGFVTVGAPDTTLTTAVSSGGGSIISASLPGGIDCGLDCSETVLSGTTVTLRALPAGAETALTGWSVTDANQIPTGECPDLNDCVVTLNGDKTVVATFGTFPTVTLLAPNGGEVIDPDSAYLIRWGAPASAERFSLGYALGPGYPFRSIANNLTGNSYRWVIPAEVLRSGNASVAVIGYTAAGVEVGRDSSDATFAFTDSLTLLTPNGGETLISGDALSDPYPITWSARLLGTTSVARTSLWLQTTPGGHWSSIATLTGNPGSYAWTVPAGIESSTARIGIIFYDASGQVLLADTSNSVFLLNTTVLPGVATPAATRGRLLAAPAGGSAFPAATLPDSPALVLLSPDGGEFLAAGTPLTILWQANVAAAHYALQVSSDNGTSWQPLASDLHDTQFDWLPEAALAGQAQVRVRVQAYDAEGRLLAEDVSNEPFTLE